LRSHTIGGDAMAQEINGGGGKNALGRINLKAVDVEQLEKLTQVAVVVLQGLAGNEVVVQVGEEERQVTKNSVH
jgi:hypothetical protein